MKRRLFALGFGLLVHSLFGVAVALMALGLYTGLQSGLGRLTGGWALTANALLVLQFPLLHSFFLGHRGRSWLKRMMPMQLGAPLATTTFAGIASLQLIMFFAGWSPMNTIVWVPSAAVKTELTILYAASWLLLLEAMREAGLGLQTGSLGWWSIWKNRAPVYPPLPVDRPLHNIVRHPIYVAFALILWTSPVFTVEKLALAIVWTFYCVAGSRIKERRLLRFHGAKYSEYMKRVPFWIPSLRKKNPVADKNIDADVIIVGGGPVGLLLANLLGVSGRRVTLVESTGGDVRRSMAIGITPPSLELLATLGLDHQFIRQGICIEGAHVHENGDEKGRLNLAHSSDTYPFILSLPQSDTVRLLRENLVRLRNVRVLTGCQAEAIEQDRTGVHLTIGAMNSSGRGQLRAAFLVACDGARGQIAHWLGVSKQQHAYAPAFMMGDFTDRSGLGSQAHLFFGRERPVESFPLPGGKRRWIVRCGWGDQTDLSESLAHAVTRLTGIKIREEDQLDASRFHPQRRLARNFYRGRVVLCGDAAHVMSPIGGQGMNTGFGDAAFLARALDEIFEGHGRAAWWFRQYERSRKQAFRRAAARAALGMHLGVAHGPVFSALRGFLVSALLHQQASHHFIRRWFTMRSLPDFRKQIDRATAMMEGTYSAT